MSEVLEAARQQAAAGEYKKAVRTLEKLEVLARYDIDEAHGLHDVASDIIACHGGSRGVRRECKFLADKADQIIRSYESAHVH